MASEQIKQNDFSAGSMPHNILKLALPMTLAQMINILYNIIDRMYIGHIPEVSMLALTGLGLTFPVITMITAFANFFGMGGAPLCSIARGNGNRERAEKIMGNSFLLLLIAGVLLTVFCLIFKLPILFLFGASKETIPYADGYLSIYLIGSIFVMIGLGMNSFINSQGFGKTGMMTVLLGAVTNLILDPLFIFVFHMGVEGAALATILSQFLSSVWIFRFLTGSKAVFRLKLSCMKPDGKIIREIISLGLSGFIMAVTNSGVQVVCNASLQYYGGDLYVGIMTVINSIREVLSMPVNGLTNGAQPVLGYNYGAGLYLRVKQGIKFTSLICMLYTTLSWLILMFFPAFFIKIFNSDQSLLEAGIPALNLYFFGFFMMSFQFSGQSAFVALGKSKYAIFFSLLRKAVIVIPLTILLPQIFNLGVNGVFLAEPISNFLGGGACFITMLLTLWPILKEDRSDAKKQYQ